MGTYGYLFAIALILLFTKLFGLASAKVHMPQVVGALIAGVLLGPSCFGILEESDFLVKVSEIGVIMLMFTAGIDTDISELKKTGGAALVIAMLGVFAPILGCGGAYFFFFGSGFDFQNFINSAFVGVVFAATSVSITVETLTELGKIKSNVGATLLAAAIIDDIIGVVVLSVLTGISDKSVNPLLITFKIFLFFIFTAVVGFIVYHLFKKIAVHHAHNRRIAVWALAFCLIMSYCAERFFGVADITGAYFAGVILCNLTTMRQYVAKKMTVASYLFFSPIFFAGIGLRTNLSGITPKILIFAAVLFIMAVITKIIGCGIGARLFKMNSKDSLRIGVGMVARGEVALMVAQKGITSGNIIPDILPAIVLCVILAALITPVLLKLSYNEKKASATT